MFNKTLNFKKAFTLLELLVVVALISILSAIATINLRMGTERARTVQCQNNLHALDTALKSYYIDHNAFPYADGDAHVRNSNLTSPSNFGEGPAANGYWSAVPFQLVDDEYLSSEEYLYCPSLMRLYPERKEHFRYAYNHAPAMDYLVIEEPPVLYSPSENEHMWVAACMHIQPEWTKENPPFPHLWEEEKGENVLYLNGSIEFEER